MRKAHIVYAHPEPQSFVASMRKTVEVSLSSSGWQTTVTDLQQSKFNPIVSDSDFNDRLRHDYLVYAKEQRHAWATETIAPEIAKEVRSLLAADLLVLVFPIYWFSVPAQMKGWIDRVMLSGTFYGGREIYEKGGMRGKKALVVASLGGREHMFGKAAIHGELKDMLRHLLQGTLGYVGYSVLDPYFAYHVPYVDDSVREGMLQDLSELTLNIDTRSIIEMPSLDKFDAQFRPI